MLTPDIDDTYERLLNWERAEKALEGDRLGLPTKTNFAIVKAEPTIPVDVDDAAILDKIIADWRFRFDNPDPSKARKNPTSSGVAVNQTDGRGTVLFKCMLASLRFDDPAHEKARICRVSERQFNNDSREAIAITHWRLHPETQPVMGSGVRDVRGRLHDIVRTMAGDSANQDAV